jgi:peptidoglycan/LPS O-acetylase OafA/YrhL
VEKEKYKNLDGLRGLAALIVVFWHFTLGFAPFLVGFNPTVRHTAFDKFIPTTPLFLPWAGKFSVYIFFVLSGFVLSLGFFHKKTIDTIISSAARRYFRLAIPVLASTVIAFIFMSVFGTGAHQATAINTESSWLTSMWTAPVSLWSAVYQGIYGAFFANFAPYNTNLWTMPIELYGSFLVFLFLALFGKLKRRWVFYIIFSLIFLKTLFLAFILGVAICDIWTNEHRLKSIIEDRLAYILLAAGLFIGSQHLSIYPSLLSRAHLPFFDLNELTVFTGIIGAACVLLATLRLTILKRFFSLRPLQYLGRISFSLYLFHFIFLCSVSSIIFNELYPRVGYKASVAAVFLISMPVILVLSTLFAKYIDEPAIKISKSIGVWLLGRPKQPQKQVEPLATPLRLARADEA